MGRDRADISFGLSSFIEQILVSLAFDGNKFWFLNQKTYCGE